MSVLSNRSLHSPSSGRQLFSPSSGRALFAGRRDHYVVNWSGYLVSVYPDARNYFSAVSSARVNHDGAPYGFARGNWASDWISDGTWDGTWYGVTQTWYLFSRVLLWWGYSSNTWQIWFNQHISGSSTPGGTNLAYASSTISPFDIAHPQGDYPTPTGNYFRGSPDSTMDSVTVSDD